MSPTIPPPPICFPPLCPSTPRALPHYCVCPWAMLIYYLVDLFPSSLPSSPLRSVTCLLWPLSLSLIKLLSHLGHFDSPKLLFVPAVDTHLVPSHHLVWAYFHYSALYCVGSLSKIIYEDSLPTAKGRTCNGQEVISICLMILLWFLGVLIPGLISLSVNFVSYPVTFSINFFLLMLES